MTDWAVTCWTENMFEKPCEDVELLNFHKEVQIALNKLRIGRQREENLNNRCKRNSNCFYHDHGKLGICYKELCSSFSNDLCRETSQMPQ